MNEIRILAERLSNAKIDLQVLQSIHRHLDLENDPMNVSATLLRCMERTRQDMEAIETAIEFHE